MASFPVFQSQGPQVDVSLFGDAALAGTKLGQAIPSTFTALTRGAIEGYETGQNIQIRDAQIDTQRAQAETAESQAKVSKSTEDARILRDNAVATAQAEQADQSLLAAQKENEFYQELQNATPAERAKIILGGKYNQVFTQNPRLFNQQLQAIYTDPNSGLDPATRTNIGQVLKIGQATDYRQKQAQGYQDKFNGAKAQLLEEPYIQESAEQLGITPEEAASNVKLVPHGSLVFDLKAGGLVPNPKYSPELAKGSYDAVDLKAGQIINGTGSIGDSSYKARSAYLNALGVVNGTYLNRDIEQIRNPPGSAVPKIPVNIPGFPTKAIDFTYEPPNLVKTPGFEVAQGLAPLVGMEAKQLSKYAGPSLMSLQRQMQQYVEDPKLRGSADYLMQQGQTINTITRSISDSQFDNTPALKAQYTDSHVKEYNAALMKSVIKEQSVFSLYTNRNNPNYAEELLSPFKVSTPQDLYYVRQRAVLEASINKYVDSTVAKLQSNKNAVGKSQQAAGATAAYLSGVAQRGPAR